MGGNEPRVSARAERQQQFLPDCVVHIVEIQCRLALVAEHLEHGWTTLIRHFHAAILEMNNVHLQRLDLEVPVVAAMWTGQRHEQYPFRRLQNLILCNGLGRRNEKSAQNRRLPKNRP